MRKYIGKISRYKGRPAKDESEYTDEEKLRQDLIKNIRTGKKEHESRKHMEEILGNRDILGVITDLFDENGKPPPHISPADIGKQYKSMVVQRKWLAALHKEFHQQRALLDPARYEKDRQVGEKAEEEQKAKVKKSYDSYLEGKDDPHPDFRKAVHGTIRDSSPAWELRQKLRINPDGRHILGVRQFETSFQCLFADIIKHRQGRPVLPPVERYDELMQGENFTLMIISQIDQKLLSMQELMASAQIYVDEVLNRR